MSDKENKEFSNTQVTEPADTNSNTENTPTEETDLKASVKGDNYEITSLEENLNDFNEDKISKLFVPHYSTGFARLDEYLGGGLIPGLTVIGAEPSLGKSTFAMQIAENIANSGRPVMYFSLEMPAKWIAAKAISRYTFTEKGKSKRQAIKTENFLDEEQYKALPQNKKDLIKEAIDKLSKRVKDNFYIIERTCTNFTAKDISTIVNKFIESKKTVPVVFVDYLQILSPDKSLRNASDKQIVDNSINELVTLANQIDNPIPIVLISSVSRRGYNKESDIGALKETGSIEYSASVILGLQFSKIRTNKSSFNRESELSADPRKMDIVFIKQRYGSNGSNVSMNYYSAYHYFEEAPKREQAPAKKKYKRTSEAVPPPVSR